MSLPHYFSLDSDKKRRKSSGIFHIFLIFCLLLVFFYSFYNIFGPEDTLPPSRYRKPAAWPENEGEQEEKPETEAPPTRYNYTELENCDFGADLGYPIRDVQKIKSQFFDCAKDILVAYAENPQDLLKNWKEALEKCEISEIPVQLLENSFKKHWALMPNCQDDAVLVSIGADQDADAVEKLKMLIPNIETYATSPFHLLDRNYDHSYSLVLAPENGDLILDFEDSNGLNEKKNVTAMTPQSFFNETLGLNRIDMLWINAEGGEVDLSELITQNKILDEMGVKVCQFNIEVKNTDPISWHRFIFSIVKQQRYIFMKPTVSADGQFTRTLFVNVHNTRCFQKFL